MPPQHPPPPQIPGRLVEDREKATQLKRHVAGLCGVDNLRFIGSQPVSFGSRDLGRLEREDYWVCEKSDGIRVLVLIVSFPSNDQEVYLIDRKNEYRQQEGLFFPHPADPRRALGNTLLDAELVTDCDPETKKETLNLLVFDCIVGDAQNLMSKSLTSRYGRLREWVIKPYQTMLREHPSMKAVQPFGIQEKEMQRSYSIEMVLQTIPNLKHGNDGLIFTCAESGYVIGTDQRILKWKPPSENSIDFKLELRFPPMPGRPSEPDYTAKPTFQLLMWMGGDAYEHFDTMLVDDAQWESWKASGEQYDDRVVEVTWNKATQNWIWHRFRDDKDHGNHHSVVDKILESIRDGVEAEQLISHANTIRANWKEREKAAASASHHPPHGGYGLPGQYGAPPYGTRGGPAFVAGLKR
ncbi:MRNA guanylyltransferase [Ceratobasidium theobromae]|uniref:mRNA-capping enzyme subunit alpha n=1 Tax=Ceratobasidium theobromae TaxID=1582974 RepID=A0A5N5QVQ1_9AGAM|nr:MRNA guanylyltransferase [Ceratobasidium theobromae]